MSWLVTGTRKIDSLYMLGFPSLYNVTVNDLLGVNIGDAFEGGFLAGVISVNADNVPTHALIVAPVDPGATGTGYTPLDTMLLWKTSTSNTTGADSTFNGAANTAAMNTAGIAAHPAAQFCVNLSIGGFTDWYLPAQYELDIAYQALKPTTQTNSNVNQDGVNPYSVPSRPVNRLVSVPAQTSITAFQSGGAQAFAAGLHHVSTDTGTTRAYQLNFTNGAFSITGTGGKSNTPLRVRAFRRIAL